MLEHTFLPEFLVLLTLQKRTIVRASSEPYNIIVVSAYCIVVRQNLRIYLYLDFRGTVRVPTCFSFTQKIYQYRRHGKTVLRSSFMYCMFDSIMDNRGFFPYFSIYFLTFYGIFKIFEDSKRVKNSLLLSVENAMVRPKTIEEINKQKPNAVSC